MFLILRRSIAFPSIRCVLFRRFVNISVRLLRPDVKMFHLSHAPRCVDYHSAVVIGEPRFTKVSRVTKIRQTSRTKYFPAKRKWHTIRQHGQRKIKCYVNSFNVWRFLRQRINFTWQCINVLRNGLIRKIGRKIVESRCNETSLRLVIGGKMRALC